MNNGPAGCGDSEQMHGGTPSSSGPAVDTPQSLPWLPQRRIMPHPPDPGMTALVPTLRAQRRGLPCLAPAQWAEVNGRRLRVANHGDDLPNLHANHHPEEAARSFHGRRCSLLLPDARLCSQPGPRCWPACRCKTGLTGPDSRNGSAKNILDTHHGTTAWCSWRVALPCQCLSRPPTCQPARPSQLRSEKREAYTAGLACGGPV